MATIKLEILFILAVLVGSVSCSDDGSLSEEGAVDADGPSEANSAEPVTSSMQGWDSTDDGDIFLANNEQLRPGVFLVKMFDGFFVLPNRFYLSVEQSGKITIKSHGATEQDGFVDRYGSVTVGDLSELGEEFPEMIRQYGGVVTNCFGFNQYVFTLKAEPGSAFEPTNAVFYDDRQYISIIVDPADNELWKFMLQDFVNKASETEKDCLEDLVIAIVD